MGSNQPFRRVIGISAIILALATSRMALAQFQVTGTSATGQTNASANLFSDFNVTELLGVQLSAMGDAFNLVEGTTYSASGITNGTAQLDNPNVAEISGNGSVGQSTQGFGSTMFNGEIDFTVSTPELASFTFNGSIGGGFSTLSYGLIGKQNGSTVFSQARTFNPTNGFGLNGSDAFNVQLQPNVNYALTAGFNSGYSEETTPDTFTSANVDAVLTVPEPTGLIVLPLGLALLRRRRKML